MAAAEKMLLRLIPHYSLLRINLCDEFLKERCEDLDLKHSDLLELRIAVAGLGAILEVVNLVMGEKEHSNGKLSPDNVILMLYY